MCQGCDDSHTVLNHICSGCNFSAYTPNIAPSKYAAPMQAIFFSQHSKLHPDAQLIGNQLVLSNKQLSMEKRAA